jgi:hypothetical protein
MEKFMYQLIFQRLTVLLVIILLFTNHVFGKCTRITIVVNHDKFSSVEKAAISEKEVNWWDSNLADDRACTESFAATELARYLQSCQSIPGVDNIRYADTDRLPESGDVFVIGSRKSNQLIEKLFLSHHIEGDYMFKTDQSLRINAFADNKRIITVIEGGDRVGSLYGIYAYLEQLGFRFYGLGEQGTVSPENLSKLPSKMNIIQNPSFLLRGFFHIDDYNRLEHSRSYDDAIHEVYYWMARNKMNYGDETGNDIPFRKKLGIYLAQGGHIVQSMFLPPKGEYPYNYPKFSGDENKPVDPYRSSNEYLGDTNGDKYLTYFEAHPEWYGLHNGKRSDKVDVHRGDNFCTSNMDANKEIAKNIVQSLIDGEWRHVDIIDFWLADNGKWCECENCRRQGTYTDRLMDVVYVVQKEIQKAQNEKRLNREVYLASLAYHETQSPPHCPLPKDFDYSHFFVTDFLQERCYVHSLADPACTEINKFLCENLQGWTIGENRNYNGSVCIGEYYNVSNFNGLPIVFPTIMSVDIPWYYKLGVKFINYMHPPTHTWGTWTLNNYLFARLIWQSETNADTLLNDFFAKYYPTTSETTRKFYKHLETALSNLKPIIHVAGKERYTLRRSLIKENREIFTLDHLHYEPYHPLLNDGPDVVDIIDELRLARKEIDASLLNCSNPIELARLMDTNWRLSYGEAMINFYYHIIRTALLHRQSKTTLAKNEFKEAEKYAGMLCNITNLAWGVVNGLEASKIEPVYEYYKKIYEK